MSDLLSFLGMLIMGAMLAGLILTCVFLWRRIRGQEAARGPSLKVLEAGLTGRFVIVAVLTLLTLVPLNFLDNLVKERSWRQSSVVQELANDWGQPQTAAGPFLAVPFTISYLKTEKTPVIIERQIERPTEGPSLADSPPSRPDSSEGREATEAAGPRRQTARETAAAQETTEETAQEFRYVTREVSETLVAALTPKTLNIDGRLDPETRRRGIFSALVYSAKLQFSGTFEIPDLKSLDARLTKVHWNEVKLIVALSNTKALRRAGRLVFAGREHLFAPGSRDLRLASSGFSADLDLSDVEGPLDFSFEIEAAGSKSLLLAPLADENALTLASSWPHPSFTGDGLPIRREVSELGFSAVWEVPALVRNYRSLELASTLAASAGGREAVSPYEEYLVGVTLLTPVDHYSLSKRAVKYAILFVALTFLSMLALEMKLIRRGGRRLHPVQHGVSALALAMFYLVLLSLSEHLGFSAAYLTASILIVSLIGAYTLAATRALCHAIATAVSLTLLYLALYLMLIQEDYALLSGTILMVAALIALMASTSKLPATKPPKGSSGPPPPEGKAPQGPLTDGPSSGGKPAEAAASEAPWPAGQHGADASQNCPAATTRTEKPTPTSPPEAIRLDILPD
ncbi:MAG: cell envelope integrity protein CreD [Deltaproteobacteria bacterium]|jgi:inner membrane protein|nr:cell envelope integrity protein CreD [Deltaproteobacteria bacterium]